MIYFSLPNLYNHNHLLNAICGLQKSRTETLKTPIQFVSMIEPIPFCYLCGGINYSTNYILNYSDLQETAKTRISYLAKRLNFANLNLDTSDLSDEYFNIILQAYSNNYSNWIEVSSIPVAMELKENGIPFELIFSQDANILCPFTEEIINTIIEQDLFKLISLPCNTKLDLTKIQNRSKLELTINNMCNNCSNLCQNICLEKENNAIYNYSNVSNFMSCNRLISYNDKKSMIISLEDINNIYLPLGIKHYKLNDFPNNENALIDFIFFFVDYFIKKEYQQEILTRLVKESRHND